MKSKNHLCITKSGERALMLKNSELFNILFNFYFACLGQKLNLEQIFTYYWWELSNLIIFEMPEFKIKIIM